MDDTLDLGTLHAKMAVDNRPYDRGIDAAHKKMTGLGKSTGQTLDQMHQKFSRSGEAMGTDLGDGIDKGVQDGAKRAAEGVDGIYRDAAGKLRTAKGKFIKEGTLLGEGVGDGIEKGALPGLGRFGRNLEVVQSKLDKASKKIGGFRGLLGTLGKTTAFAAVITGAAGAASALGPVVSLAGTLVIAAAGIGAVLPVALLSGVAAAAALKVGLTGVGDAIAGDEEALKRLPKPARDFASAVRGLQGDWDDVTKSVQSKLFEDVADIFTKTAGTVLPRLKTGLTAVAGGWNAVFKETLKAATTPRFLAGLDALLKSTGAGLTAMASGMEGWFRGIGVLLSTVSPMLEDAGRYAGELGDRFGDWMERARASGQLQSTLQTMLDTLSMLGGIVTNVGSIFNSVFGAAHAQGGGLLGIIEDLTGRAKEFFDSAEGKTKLNDFFARLSDVAAAVTPIILAVVGAVAELAPKIADIATGVGPTFADLVEKIGDFIGKIDAETLADGLADVLGAVTGMIGPLGDFLGWLTSIDGLIPVLVISFALFTIAVWALNTALYANPIVWVIALVIALIAVIVLIVVNWDRVVVAFQERWALIVNIWNAGQELLRNIWSALFDYVKARVSEFLALMQTFGELPGRIGAWFGDMKDRAIERFQAFLSAANAKIDAVLGAIQRMGGIPGKIAGFIQSAKDSAISKFTSLVDWVKGLPERITDALGNLGNLLKNAGRDIVQSLIDGLQEKFSDVQDKLGELTNMLPDWKGPEAVDRRLFRKPAHTIMRGFADDLQSMFPLVRKVLGALTSEMGLSVDASAGPQATAAPTVVVQPAPPPGEFTASAVIDLGEGVQRVVDITFERHDRDLKRRVNAGTGAAR